MRLQFSVTLALVAFVACKSDDKRPVSSAGSLVEAVGAPSTDPERFTCAVAGRDVVVASSGQGTIRHASGRTYSFTVPVGDGGIESARCASVNGDVLIIAEVNNVEEGWGVGARLSGSPAVKWSVNIPTFNVGEPLISGDFVYVSAIGFVGKIDLRSGEYMWKHSGLYRRPGMYNSFAAPHLEDGRVVFPAKHERAEPTWPKALVLDAGSGAILTGAPPPVTTESAHTREADE